jgi:hypothetical protein
MELPSPKIIKDSILNNWIEYQYLFVESQSKFLSSLYSRYQSVENGNLVLYFEKQTHQDILRQRDYDLNFNISLEKFWANHHNITPKRISLIRIAEDTLLPKETTRRKILQLIKLNVLSKKNRNIGWLPNEQYKQSYNLVINNEINDLCKIIIFICKKINFSISKEKLTKELKEKFSFYWFHYLGVQLEYLRQWNKQFDDSEVVLVFLQLAHLFTLRAKEKNLSHKELYDDPSLLKDFVGASISATSISEVTQIPRATCVRKLETLVKLKAISQDKISKRYYIIPNVTSDDLVSRKTTEKIVEIFSEFFFICIRAINTKT